MWYIFWLRIFFLYTISSFSKKNLCMFVRAIKLLPSQHKRIKYQFIRFPRYFCISVYIEVKTLKYLTSFWLWDFYEHAQHISDTSAFCNIIIPQTKKFKIYTILNLLNMLDELINKEYYCRLVYAWLSSPARYRFFFFFFFFCPIILVADWSANESKLIGSETDIR